ncbi:amidohydrolase [Aestuariivirga sp.]|jgi:predicted amidohydrolase YtcJ|uniref:amidohydrolase n=1 Tax=Aestuariivirga sp. TaxID=2650926 RepID=UPI0037847848
MTSKIDRRDFMKAGAAAFSAVASVDVGPAMAQDSSSPSIEHQLPAIFHNGNILTMEGDTPDYVEAVAIKDGKIAFAGPMEGAIATVPEATQIDLQGHTMLPGFIDSWGHFTLLAQQTLGVNLAYFSPTPPRDKADVIKALKQAVPFNGWIIGYGYIAALLSDGPLSLADLDSAFPETPVMICTLSTLTGQVNSAGIAKLGLTAQTEVTKPGEIVKDPETGKLTGELTFTPFLAAREAAVGSYSEEQTLRTFAAAEALLAQQGYTTVQSYQLTPQEVKDLRTAFDRGSISLDVIGMPSISDAATGEMVKNADWTWGAYSHDGRGLKIPGYQVATDAAPQLRLAAFSKPYLDTTGFPDGWKGILLPQEIVEHWVGYAYENGIQLFVYSNGDAGIDLSLAAIQKAIAATGRADDRRTSIAHSYFVRPDQLEIYKALDIGASMMPPHMMIYGDLQMKLLGPERASLESPLASASKLGLRTMLHCDCPSASPNMMEAIWTAVSRKTLSGQVLGPEEQISPYAALLAATRNVAYSYREETSKGTITAGKSADLVIIDANPLTVPPDMIREIKVVETIKRGKTLYRA